jgi:hypothetical protein
VKPQPPGRPDRLERAPDEVAAIEVRADGEARSSRGAVRTMFNQLGERSFENTTYGADGVARGTLRRTFVLE